MQQIFFFDIDGTLWDERSRFPESVPNAIARAHEAGCLCFINSGRTRAFIRDPRLFAMGFDGVVSGGGTMVEFARPSRPLSPDFRANDVRFVHEIDAALARETISLLRAHGFRTILEGREFLYVDREEFGDDPFIAYVAEGMGSALLPIRGNEERLQISKMSCDLKRAHDQEACLAAMARHFYPLWHTDTVLEYVPLGCTKGTGIERVCELTGAPIESTVAFGDGPNDLPMFEAAGYAVALGSGDPVAHRAADFVTAPLWEDGLYKGVLHALERSA